MCVHCCRLFNFLQSIFHLQSCGEVSHERGNNDRGRLVKAIAAVYQHPVQLDHSWSVLNYSETRVHPVRLDHSWSILNFIQRQGFMEEKTDLPPPASASRTKLVVNLSVEEEKESLRKYICSFPIFAFISLLQILNS